MRRLPIQFALVACLLAVAAPAAFADRIPAGTINVRHTFEGLQQYPDHSFLLAYTAKPTGKERMRNRDIQPWFEALVLSGDENASFGVRYCEPGAKLYAIKGELPQTITAEWLAEAGKISIGVDGLMPTSIRNIARRRAGVRWIVVRWKITLDDDKLSLTLVSETDLDRDRKEIETRRPDDESSLVIPRNSSLRGLPVLPLAGLAGLGLLALVGFRRFGSGC